MILADVYCIVRRTVKITEEAPVVTLKRPLAYDNAYAHAVEVTLINDDDTPADLTGAGVVATMLRADGRGVSPINGTITGNIAQVILPPACYVVPGRIKLTVNLAKPTSPAGVDAFSASTAYSKGDLVVVNGVVYRFTDDHPQGEWTGTDATPDSTVRTIIWVEGTAERNTSAEMVDPGSSYGITAAIGEANAAAASATQAASLATQAAQEATEAADHSVQYNSTQTLTTAQKATARANIGLSAVDDGNGNITFS